jgi:Domain of unknown function (DUF4340)
VVEEVEAVSLRITLILMVLFMALGTLAIFEPLRRQQKEQEKKEHESLVLWLKDKKLERIRIPAEKSEETVDLQCALPEGCPFSNQGEWNVLSPFKSGGDAGAIGALASSFFNLPQHERLDFEGGAVDPKEFGFDRPSAEVELWVKGENQPYDLKFGKASEVGPNVYLSSSRDPKFVFLVPNYSANILKEKPAHWRNKRFYPGLDPQPVVRLRWKTVRQEIAAIQEDGHWRLVAPLKARASDLALAGLVSTVIYGEGKRAIANPQLDPEVKKVTAGKPELEIEFAGKTGEARRLLLYPFANGSSQAGAKRRLLAIVPGNDAAFEVEAPHFDRFHRDLKDFREIQFLDPAFRSGISELKLRFPREKKQLVLRLEQGSWVASGGDKAEKPISQERINAFLDALRDSPATDFPAPESAGGKYFRSQPFDLSLTAVSSGGKQRTFDFLVRERKSVLVGSDGELKEAADPLLKTLPVRFMDLTAAANQQVVMMPPEKEAKDGSSSKPKDGK